MIYRNILLKWTIDLIIEVVIRLRERRIQKEKEAAEKAEKERLKKQRLDAIKKAKENFDKIDPSKIEVN
jgi:hypothetical protein